MATLIALSPQENDCTLVDALIVAKVDGEWPDSVISVLSGAWILSPHPTIGEQLRDGLDALYGAAKETP